MFAIGFVLFFVAVLLDEVIDQFSDRHVLYAYTGTLGLLLMAASFTLWLWRVMP